MSSFDAVVNLNAKDNASPVVDAATKNILANWKVMRQEVRATTAEFQLQNQTLVAASNAFRSIGSVAGSFMNIYQQYQTMQIRSIDAQNSLILAQLHYNQVLAEQGPGTIDAIAASIQLQEAKQGVATATRDETIGYIGMAFELGSTVSLMISAIPKIQQFIKQMGLARTAALEANAAANTPIGTGPGGGLGKAGKLGAGIGALAGLGVAGAGVLSSQALSSSPLSLQDKLLSVGEQAGGGALTGAMIGSIVPGLGTLVGAGVGGGIGAASGIATNFGSDIMSFFSGIGKSGNQGGRVEHVVTIKIENATDHKVSATETAMGIEQVMGSNR